MEPFGQIECDVELMRKRPENYFNDTGALGYHQFVLAGILESYYEARRDYCNAIQVEFGPDGTITVSDDGRPVRFLFEGNAQYGNVRSPIKPTMLSPREGRKLEDEEFALIPAKRREIGLFLPIAASEKAELLVRHDGAVQLTRFEKGYCSKENEPAADRAEELGAMTNRFSYRIDEAVMPSAMNAGLVRSLVGELRGYAAATSGLRIGIIDRVNGFRQEFYYPNGIVDYAAELGCVPLSYETAQPFYYSNAVGESVEMVRLDPVISPRVFHCFVNGFSVGTFGHHWAAILGGMADLGENSAIRYPDDVSMIMNLKLKNFDFKKETDLIGNNIYLLVYNAFISYVSSVR